MRRLTEIVALIATLIIPFMTNISLAKSFSPILNQTHLWQTAEGADVYHLPLEELPIVDIIIALDVGDYHSGPQHGVATLTASLLGKSAGPYDEEALLEALEERQTLLSTRVSSNKTLFTFRTRSVSDGKTHTITDEAKDLITTLFAEPRFDEQIFLRERANIIDAQKARLDNINAIASEIYYQNLYPNEYLGVTSEMFQEALAELTLSDLKQFHRQYYHATNAKIIIVGKISHENAADLARTISLHLGRGEQAPPIEHQPPNYEAKRIEHPFDSPQSRILMGHPSINFYDEDYFPLLLGNHILGGSGLTSELMIRLREELGLTYGIYSSFAPTLFYGPFTITFSTKNEQVDEAIAESLALIERFIEEGPSDKALELAKNNLIGSLALDLDSNAKLAATLLHLASYDLPLDYYDHYPEIIRGITKEEIKAAFKRHLNPQRFTVVIVGGKEADQKSPKPQS